MRTKTRMITLAMLFTAATVCFAAENAAMGTWKLNEAKSKVGSGMQKGSTVVYSADGDNIKVTVDGTTGDGKPLHDEWTGKFDGKDYAVTGDPSADMRAYTQVNPHTLRIVGKKDGKIVSTGRIVISADGKSRTVTITATDSAGKKMSTTEAYDKQ